MLQIELSDTQKRVEACIAFTLWIEKANRRDKFMYYEGEYLHQTLSGIQVQKLTYQLAEKGVIYLVQKRIGKSSRFGYIAIKASKDPYERLLPVTPDYHVRTKPKMKEREYVEAH